MRPIFGLGLIALALNIPIWAQRHHGSNKPKPVSAADAKATLPPLVFTSQAAKTKSNRISSGMVIEVPQFLPISTANHIIMVPNFSPLATTTTPKTSGVSSNLVVKVPDFLPAETHK